MCVQDGGWGSLGACAVIQAYQQTMMRTELERLREENAEQRRLLEQARDAMQHVVIGVMSNKTGWGLVTTREAITQHLKGKE